MRRISARQIALQVLEMDQQQIGQVADRPPAADVFPERPERIAVVVQPCPGNIDARPVGRSIGGPTRPGVSLIASYQASLALRWWLWMLHTTSRPSRPI